MSILYSLFALGLAASVQASPQPFGPPKYPSRPPGFTGGGQSAGSPAYPYIFEKPLPIPPVAQPKLTQTVEGVPIQFYEVTISSFDHQVYPDLGPARLTGYNGTAPGPTFMIPRGTETVVRYVNNGTENSTVHLHGSFTHSVWDGWASDEIAPGQFKDYYYPNSESARAMWYHDHVHKSTAKHAYYGQAGAYIIYDPAEDSLGLPKGNYDIPLALTDKTYQANGDLVPPTGNAFNFFGDTIQVNEQPWPFLAVEPRKYRLRLFDMSLSRPFDLYFADSSSNPIQFQVIASDSGLFSSPVTTKDVLISMGERYEVVIDFSKYAGQNVTLMNGLQQSLVAQFNNTDKVMRFVVGNSVSDSSNNGDVPSNLNSTIAWPAKRTTVDHTFNFQLGGEDTWTINGVTFDDVNNRVLARPPQGTVELWELHHTGGPAVHPVHIHLVNMQVISRTGGSRGLLPYESAGLKDIVLLEPGETVRVLAVYGPWNGMYMFHCHNLIHEDQAMIDVFNVTKLEALGYTYNSTSVFNDPSDNNFGAQAAGADVFDTSAESAAIQYFGSLNAYAPAASLLAAEEAYYSTAGYNGETSTGLPKVTAVAVSSGVGFVQNAAPTSTALFGREPNAEASPAPTAAPVAWQA